MRKILAVASLLVLTAFDSFAQTPEIMEKPDPALGVMLFIPKSVAPVAVENVRSDIGQISFRVYPTLYQTLNKSEKAAVMKIDILGLPTGFSNASLVVTIDGQAMTIPSMNWAANETTFGDSATSTQVGLLDATGSFRRIATAKDVYLTVLLPGMASRYTVHLAGENLNVFKMMLSKYDSLDVQPQTATPAATIVTPTSTQQSTSAPTGPKTGMTGKVTQIGTTRTQDMSGREVSVQAVAITIDDPTNLNAAARSETYVVMAQAFGSRTHVAFNVGDTVQFVRVGETRTSYGMLQIRYTNEKGKEKQELHGIVTMR
jgi:hypothetical protein